MVHSLKQSVQAWRTNDYEATLKQELCSLPGGALPLHLATEQGGMVDDSAITVSVLNSTEQDMQLHTRVYVFFDEIVGGCNCHDDPVASKMQCEMLVSIDMNTGNASFNMVNE